MSILEQVEKAVQEMSPDQIREELLKAKQEAAARKEKQLKYNADPKNKEKRLAYSKEYREKNPEKFKAQRKAYMERPEVKAKQKAYRQERNARHKALLARAKELGITV